MKPRRGQALGAVTLLPSAFSLFGAACSYDFDRFVHERAAASAAGESSVAGRAGAGGTGGTLGGHGGGGVAGGPSEKAGAAGALEEAGAAGLDTTGGTSGGAGRAAQGGSANGAGQGGKPSGGTGGATSSAGRGGTSSAGAAGGGTPSCTGSGATSYGGHCYFLVGDDAPLDWSAAKSACAAHSSTAHLVAIGSKEEQTMLVTAFFPATLDTWIGLSLDDVTRDPSSICRLAPDQCPFKWVTGEQLDYTNWTVRSGTDSEPNYTGACVRMQATDQTWGDTACSTKLRALCEEGS